MSAQNFRAEKVQQRPATSAAFGGGQQIRYVFTTGKIINLTSSVVDVREPVGPPREKRTMSFAT